MQLRLFKIRIMKHFGADSCPYLSLSPGCEILHSYLLSLWIVAKLWAVFVVPPICARHQGLSQEDCAIAMEKNQALWGRRAR